MAIEVVQKSQFTFDFLGDGLSTVIAIDVSSQNIRTLLSILVTSGEGITAIGAVTGRRLTITFSAPFLGVARVTGEYVQ